MDVLDVSKQVTDGENVQKDDSEINAEKKNENPM
jgi:hypothetical protein